jgi:hypothetical protein
MRTSLLLLPIILSTACPGDDAVPLFPADYAATYAEVRDCRGSADHDLHFIRVLADPQAVAPYMGRMAPFPDGAVLLKEEHDFGDTDCSQPPIGWTVMVRDGAATDSLGWQWQKVDVNRKVVSENEARCFNCHTDCGIPPDGYLGTCAVP